MNKTTTGLMLFAAGLVFGSAEPLNWNVPVGIGMVLIGLVLMNWKKVRKFHIS